jgi:acetyl-CoA synthetase
MADVSTVLPTSSTFSPQIEVLRDDCKKSLDDPEGFWRKVADELFWYDRSGPVLRTLPVPPFAKWFEQWKTNLAYNAIDRHLTTSKKNKVAYYWEGENGDRRTLSYYDLFREVNQLASAFRKMGVRKGDRVTIYLPMIPELPIALLATVRLGAIHSVIFGGFAARAIVDRVNDSDSKVVIAADGGFRRGKVIPLKPIVDQALKETPSVEKVIVVKRTGNPVEMKHGRDLWYDEIPGLSSGPVAPEPVEGTHPSFILYTSGTTGKPKGATHSTAGYMVWAYLTQKRVFDSNDEDVYWFTADIGWVTGHTYIVYGPLLQGMTSFFYEGVPDYPQPDKWWSLIERYKITTLYTAPTAIRMHMKYGPEWAKKHDLSSLRILGTVGEPINPEAWRWYYEHIGGNRTPIVDTWWQTETGGIMISPQPGMATIPLKPGSATFPLPGVDADIMTQEGTSAGPGEKGFLVIKRSWPGQFMTLWKDHDRFKSVYFERFPGFYYPGDFALRDGDGYFWLLGRADEVLKVAGHRIGTIELEDALAANPAVAKSAVIGKADPIKMQVPVAFVTLKQGRAPSEELRKELSDQIRSNIGAIAVPERIYFVSKLPKTRSGKIMRRVIGAVVDEKPIGDVSTLEDETTVEEAKNAYQEFKAQIQASKG